MPNPIGLTTYQLAPNDGFRAFQPVRSPWKQGGVTLGCAAPQSGGMLIIISTALGCGDPISNP